MSGLQVFFLHSQFGCNDKGTFKETWTPEIQILLRICTSGGWQVHGRQQRSLQFSGKRKRSTFKCDYYNKHDI